MAPNPRVAKAFRAMKCLGIPEEKTKPVLKRLIKIYDKNWELIEEENYRALADAIFEEAEACFSCSGPSGLMEEQKKTLEQAERLIAMEEETQIQEDSERPLKRSRLRQQDGHGLASPSTINACTNSNDTLLKKPKLEAGELPSTTEPVSPLIRGRNKGKQPVLPNASGRLEGSGVSQSMDVERTHSAVADGAESDSVILSRHLKGKGKEHVSQQSAGPRENISTPDKPSSAVRFKEPKVEPGIGVVPKQKGVALVKPKDEPLADGPPCPRFEVPLAVIMPDSLANGDISSEIETESNPLREPDFVPLTSEPAENVDLSNRELVNVSEESSAKLDIASSSSGRSSLF
ncbi:hypothetical protein OSB04_020463 [Centaurea solstitialis]|uniref:WIYLD domain-containing protein n=1 Tax=Centaurea solstitialis TaxID=347529 RepID=A0AA38SSA2_9ASTR|nr:hypothetical protein OSB04_020463 [Centaurea solstitialis]